MSLVVLKFGSSVLSNRLDLPLVVEEIYRHVRRGSRVVAVVSAIGETTDRLQREAFAFDDSPSETGLARLLATGELRSAALLELELESWGVASTTLSPERIGLRTTGPILDAEPQELDDRVIHRAFEHHSVVVVPGFYGCAEDGNTSLLGRGGSDLTALFLAQRLGAEACLLKDTEGIYVSDPRRSLERGEASPDRYQLISWEDALALRSEVVQDKTIEFAQRHGFEFDVARIGCPERTRVGRGASASTSPPAQKPVTRVGLLGHGTVGSQVLDRLRRRTDVEVVGVAVRDPERHRGNLESAGFFTSDPWDVVRGDAEVILELTGSTEAEAWIESALSQGKDVVTAHKEVIARVGPRLDSFARSTGGSLRYSAAVGGALPVLEIVQRHASQGIRRVEGVLNGTTNFVLDRLAAGDDLATATALAQRRGFAEADPSRDLSGADAAAKIQILARAAFGRDPAELRVEGVRSEALPSTRPGSPRLRHMARTWLEGEPVVAEVCLVAPDDPFLSETRGEENRVLVELASADRVYCRGRGAGGRPTCLSVLADFNDLQQERLSRTAVECS